jgi:hypothetical protein
MESTVTLTAPPEWVSLPEAREAIKQRCGERAVEIIDRLREMLPEGFPHRIGGWSATHRQWPHRKVPFHAGYDGSRWPAWLAEDRLGQMQVQDWELAQVDWEAGTVRNLGGHRSPIELRWRHITEWMRTGRIGDAVEPVASASEPSAVSDAPTSSEIPATSEVPATTAVPTMPEVPAMTEVAASAPASSSALAQAAVPSVALPAFDFDEAAGLMGVWKLKTLRSGTRSPIPTQKEIEAWVKARWSGHVTDGAIRKLMGVWPGRKRGAIRGKPRRNKPNKPQGPEAKGASN